MSFIFDLFVEIYILLEDFLDDSPSGEKSMSGFSNWVDVIWMVSVATMRALNIVRAFINRPSLITVSLNTDEAILGKHS